MASQTRYVLEGEWTGYRSSQQRVVHREVITGEKRAYPFQRLHTILYTDNTRLLISVREAEPRERVQEIHSYSELIRDAVKTGQPLVRVADLPA